MDWSGWWKRCLPTKDPENKSVSAKRKRLVLFWIFVTEYVVVWTESRNCRVQMISIRGYIFQQDRCHWNIYNRMSQQDKKARSNYDLHFIRMSEESKHLRSSKASFCQ
jgi:hypothetical protein